jgi:hypothetical protein
MVEGCPGERRCKNPRSTVVLHLTRQLRGRGHHGPEKPGCKAIMTARAWIFYSICNNQSAPSGVILFIPLRYFNLL